MGRVRPWLTRKIFIFFATCLLSMPFMNLRPSDMLYCIQGCSFYYTATQDQSIQAHSPLLGHPRSLRLLPRFWPPAEKKKTCSMEIFQINGTAQVCSHLAFLGATRSWYFFSHAAQGTPNFRSCSLWSCYHHLTLTIIHIQYSCARLLLPSWTD